MDNGQRSIGSHSVTGGSVAEEAPSQGGLKALQARDKHRSSHSSVAQASSGLGYRPGC